MARDPKKGAKKKSSTRALSAKPVGKREAGAVKGGVRDAASGLPTGKRTHKP